MTDPKDLHTYRPPERFEEHWNENRPGVPVKALIGVIVAGAIFWVVVAWIFVARYF